MPRPIVATIDLNAMRHNLQAMRKFARGRTLWAVVKANAYGHRIENAVRGFDQADGLALLDIEEALKARRLGWKKRILLLEGFFEASDIEVLEEHGIETIIHSDWMIEMLEAKRRPLRIQAHIKINSGMNRLGYLAGDVERVRERLNALPGVRILGLVTHFANSDPSYPKDGPYGVAYQLARMGGYERAASGLCMANSAALVSHEEVGGDAVRAGIVLYGATPDDVLTNEALGIIPAMTLSAKILAIRHIDVGDAVGYCSRWVAKRPSRIAFVACGYVDGYPRLMPDGAPTYVKGHIAPLAGRVCMDMMAIDVTDFPDVAIGDTVELWGKHILVNDLARLCGTVGYELICAVAPRVPFVAVE